MLFTAHKIKFDPNNSDHIKAFKAFRDKSNWKEGCPFQLEWPYSDIPSMIVDKIIKTHLAKIIDWTKDCQEPSESSRRVSTRAR